MEKTDLEREFGRPFDTVNDNYRALCPFHDERTPSFLIHTTDLVGHCFGCGVGGSVETLLSRSRGITVEEARRHLGITADDSLRKARAKKQNSRVPIRTYPESWLAPWKKEAHEYVIRRGFTTKSLRAVGSLYDSHFKRQVFPHRDREGKLLGCTGRTCVGEEPKWYHYWGYDKGQFLYQPFRLDSLRPILVVEGPFDLLWLYQNGVDNVVATLGANLSESQSRALKDCGRRFILGYDSDTAGRTATDRAHKRLSHTSRVEFVQWPIGAHDWMDLNSEQIGEVLSHTTNYVQRSLIQNTNPSSREVMQQA